MAEQNHSVNVMEMLLVHAMQNGQVSADGRTALAEFTRLSYLSGKDLVSFREATGVRHVTEAGKTNTQANANA